MIYKLINNSISQQPCAVLRFNEDGTISSFIFVPANTDYANFKKEILADEAQLQDADGNIMTDAKEFILTLP